MYLAARGNVISSTLIVIVCTLLQIFFEYKQKNNLHGVGYLIILLVIAGGCVDSVAVYYKILVFAANPWAPYATSPWMLTIWASFAVNMFCLMPNLLKRPALLAALCLPGFAAAYYVGAQIGAASFPLGDITCLGIGLVWSILLPICSYMYSKIKGE